MSAVNFITDPATPTGRLLLVALILVALALVPWVGKAPVVLVQGVMDVVKIRAKGKVWADLAKLEPDQVERLQAHLERVRPPPVDAIEPPPDSLGDLAQLQTERDTPAPGASGACS